MVGWHHWLEGHEFKQAPGIGEGQGSLACCSPGVTKSWTQPRDWTASLGPAIPPWAKEESTWLRNQNPGSFFPILKLNILFNKIKALLPFEGPFGIESSSERPLDLQCSFFLFYFQIRSQNWLTSKVSVQKSQHCFPKEALLSDWYFEGFPAQWFLCLTKKKKAYSLILAFVCKPNPWFELCLSSPTSPLTLNTGIVNT